MKEVSTIGIDLAKSVFQVHGADDQGHTVFTRKLRRRDVLAFFAKLPPCLVGMEACATAHHWARELEALGHRVRLLPPRYVKAYVRRGKTDAADAAAIAEAVTRPALRAVPVKSIAQQSVLMLHRARELLIRQRTQTINALRAHLAELGIVAPTGHEGLKSLLSIIADARDGRLPPLARSALQSLAALLMALGHEIARLDRAILMTHREDEASRRLATVPGIGPVAASALTATVADARVFRSGRSFAAWLGLTPRLDGTGGRVTLGPVTKQGDRYLRRLLVMGAVAVLARVRRQPAQHPWAAELLGRLKFKAAAVALANKTARIVWALLARGESYRPGHRPAQLAAAA